MKKGKIEKKEEIDRNYRKHVALSLQFENLVVHSRKTLWNILGISPEEIVMEGPFFQTPTTKQAGCQIDYMVQTRFHNLYVCEIKFSKNPIGKKIIEEMEKKEKT